MYEASTRSTTFVRTILLFHHQVSDEPLEILIIVRQLQRVPSRRSAGMEGSRVEIRTVSYCTSDERSADGIETWRFFVPIFLHVGIVHFLLNMVAQVFAGSQVEKEMGKAPLSRWTLMIRINPIPDRLLCWWFIRKYLRREL